MYRLFTVAVVVLWISSMGALFVRDIWPAWSAQDVPPMKRENVAELTSRQEQYGIFAADGKRMGTAWSNLDATEHNSTIRGTVALEAVPPVPPVRVETETEFDAEGGLDSFRLQVHGLPMTRILVHGERRGIYFPCELHAGPFHRQANLDMSATRLIGDSLKPFGFLPDLHVGQSWRMQILNPMSAVFGGHTRFQSLVARVTRTETIEHRGRTLECFVIETAPQQVTAWVDPEGRVLVQEVELPGVGKVQVREEDYNKALRAAAKRTIRGQNGTEP